MLYSYTQERLVLRKVKICNYFLNFKGLSQEPLHQHLACLYSFWCIFHVEFKYGHENLNCENVWKKLENFGLSSALNISMENAIIKNTSFFRPKHLWRLLLNSTITLYGSNYYYGWTWLCEGIHSDKILGGEQVLKTTYLRI